MEGRIQTLFLIIVFQCGVIYGTASRSPCGPVYHTFELAHSRRALKNLHIQEMHCLPSLFFGDRYRVRNLLTLVI